MRKIFRSKHNLNTMSALARAIEKNLIRNAHKTSTVLYYSNDATKHEGEFRVLNLRHSKNQMASRRKFQKPDIQPPRTNQMAVDQDWGSVWPGPRTFHPATVPLPLRQGYVKRGAAAPYKFGNAELMKIPNFLHLTPPVVKRQCEALKQFCTPWPANLPTEEAACSAHFPLEVTRSSYCHSSPTIRDPMARIVTVKFPLDRLKLDRRATDKFLRLVGERYDEQTGCVTIVTDRCPTKKQNYDYAVYLITALYHESMTVEPWEALKSEADMEYYDWEKSASKSSIETLFGADATNNEDVKQYADSVDKLMNEGESEYTVSKYGESVRKLLNLPVG